MTFQEFVPAASVLYAVTVPPAEKGGATQFVDMRAATESMPPHLLSKISEGSLRHCSSYRSDGSLPAGRPEVFISQGKIPHRAGLNCLFKFSERRR